MPDISRNMQLPNPEECLKRQLETQEIHKRRAERKELYRQQKFDELDATDGKVDGKISASVWNEYAKSVGSEESQIKNYITVDNARKWFDKQSWFGAFD